MSWHAQHGADRGKSVVNRDRKRAAYSAFIAWVRAQPGPLLVGTDANHGSFYVREEDFPDSPMKGGFKRNAKWEENTWWTQEDPDLRDAWIEYLPPLPIGGRGVRSSRPARRRRAGRRAARTADPGTRAISRRC